MVGLELGLLLLCYREGLRCDLWCLVLRWDWNWAYYCCVIGRVWDVTYDNWYYGRDWNWAYCCCSIGKVWDVTYGVWYYGRDLNMYLPNISHSTEWRPVRFMWQLLICGAWGYMRGIAPFIFYILVVLSVQLRAPANLATEKYSPVALAVERRLSGSTEAVWMFCERDKNHASTKNRKTIPRKLFGGLSLY